MSPLRWTLVALLIASTALFAVGAIAERSSRDTHSEPAAAHAAETGSESGEPGGAHGEGGAPEATASGEPGHDESASGHGVGKAPRPVTLRAMTADRVADRVAAALLPLALAAVALALLVPSEEIATRADLLLAVLVAVTALAIAPHELWDLLTRWQAVL